MIISKQGLIFSAVQINPRIEPPPKKTPHALIHRTTYNPRWLALIRARFHPDLVSPVLVDPPPRGFLSDRRPNLLGWFVGGGRGIYCIAGVGCMCHKFKAHYEVPFVVCGFILALSSSLQCIGFAKANLKSNCLSRKVLKPSNHVSAS